ncbi:hypothetical protein PGS49_22850 [Yersinia intermedia]|uniref:hypothetical protein n=1 Tax=Yersinia intermedia TaxID=631 RepID=UPI0022FF0C6E|nr:hypothetical protein [Yersinia intermedia]MDA5483437.1 hypothetical protein [Yersinia intermedia]
MKKFLRVFVLLPVLMLLTACNDSSTPLERVRSLPLPVRGGGVTGMTLDNRPVCDQTTWRLTTVNEGTSTVEYRCTVSAAQTQTRYQAQMDALMARHQRRLTEVERGADTLRAFARRGEAQEPQLLAQARTLFEQLQAHGDLARYKALIKNSPVHNLRLDAVKAFFASEAGDTYLATTTMRPRDITAAKASLAVVTASVAATGLATDTQNIDVCQTPALLVLAVILTPKEVGQGFRECEESATARYQAYTASADRQVAEATAQVDKVRQRGPLTGVQESLTWSVPVNGIPQLTQHVLTVSVSEGKVSDGEGEVIARVTECLGLTPDDLEAVVSGDINRVYQDALTRAITTLLK